MATHKSLILGTFAALVLLAQATPQARDYASRQWFPPEQLERMVAPIALYSDALLAQILMAAGYPDQVREAAHWRRRHAYLRDEALAEAVERQSWDPSVTALLYFPQVLKRMDDYPDWTEDLGMAFARQEDDLMDAVQRLRQEAWAAGNLRSTPEQYVYREGDIIVIQPADSRVVYVPTYDADAIYTREYSSSGGLIDFGAGAVVGGLLTAAILWDSDRHHDRPRHHIYSGGHGRWRDHGYWNHQGYRKGGWRHPDRISHWRRHDYDRHESDRRDHDRHRNDYRHSSPSHAYTPPSAHEDWTSDRHQGERHRSHRDRTPAPVSKPSHQGQPPRDTRHRGHRRHTDTLPQRHAPPSSGFRLAKPAQQHHRETGHSKPRHSGHRRSKPAAPPRHQREPRPAAPAAPRAPAPPPPSTWQGPKSMSSLLEQLQKGHE
jgi:hypothetical protein